MSLPRFYIRLENWTREAPILTGAEAHHARDVLRLTVGDQVVLFDGRGRERTAEISEIGRREMRLRVLQEKEAPTRPCRITLAQAIPKGKNMDLIVQKAVELGAAEIIPLISERTVVSLDSKKDREKKQAKWEQIAIEAMKQCGQSWLPEIRPPMGLSEFLGGRETEVGGRKPEIGSRRSEVGKWQNAEATEGQPFRFSSDRRPLTSDLRIVASLQEDSLHLKEILRRYEAEQGARPTEVTMLIGPEGDLTPDEYAAARAAGFQPITLGSIILRVETAAIYCLSVLSYELLGDVEG